MPEFFHERKDAEWLDPKTPVDRLKELLRPFPSELLAVRAVSPRVGSSAVDEPALREQAVNAPGDLFA